MSPAEKKIQRSRRAHGGPARRTVNTRRATQPPDAGSRDLSHAAY